MPTQLLTRQLRCTVTASQPHDLVARAAERGITTRALTDRDTVTGIGRFAKAATAASVRPAFGVDVEVAPHTRSATPPDGRPVSDD